MDLEQNEFDQLKEENQQLRAELDHIRSHRIQKRRATWWFTKKAGGAFAGHWLRNSFLRLYKEIPEQRVQKETLADVSASLFWRITRIGIITIILAMLPTAILLFQTNILVRQNKLLAIQNVRLDQQTNLLEAERRSSLVYIMGSLLDQLDSEIDREGGYISDVLIARIAGLTQSLKPYRFLENDALTTAAWSPEKGQLFLNLALTEMNRNSKAEVFKKANLTYSDLKGAEFNLLQLADARLAHSRFDNTRLFNCSWAGTDLIASSFRQTWIEGTEFHNSIFDGSDLGHAGLFDNVFAECSLQGCNLSGTLLNNVSFLDCNLQDIQLNDAIMANCTFIGSSDISGIEWNGVVVDDAEWLTKLEGSGIKGADQLTTRYHIGTAVDLSTLAGEFPEFKRFDAMNKDKQFYIIQKK